MFWTRGFMAFCLLPSWLWMNVSSCLKLLTPCCLCHKRLWPWNLRQEESFLFQGQFCHVCVTVYVDTSLRVCLCIVLLMNLSLMISDIWNDPNNFIIIQRFLTSWTCLFLTNDDIGDYKLLPLKTRINSFFFWTKCLYALFLTSNWFL